MSKPKNKKFKSKYKQPTQLHEALSIPEYTPIDHGEEEIGEVKKDKEKGEKCPSCGKLEKNCKC